jgi:hypothetical protein
VLGHPRDPSTGITIRRTGIAIRSQVADSHATLPRMSARRTKAPPAKSAVPPVDRALKSAWERLAKAIAAASAKESADYDRLWEAVAEVVEHDPPLYLAGGYRTATEFYAKHLHVDLRTGTRNVRVAKHATPADEAKYGPAKLDAALSYVEATHGPLKGALPVAFDRLKIATGRGKSAKLVRLAEISQAKILAATRAVLGQKSATPKDAVRASIERTLSPHPAFADVHVSQRAGFASFAHVPIASLATFGRALTQVKLPEVAAKKPAPTPKRARKGKRRAR